MEELENLRKRYLRHMVIGTIISVVVILVIALSTQVIEVLFIGTIIAIIIVAITGASKKKAYDDTYKKDIVTTTMQEIFTDVVVLVLILE